MSAPHVPSRRQARLRTVGVLVFLLGIGSAEMVYWMGTRSPDLTDNLSMVGYNRTRSRQMGMLYGKMGLMIDDLTDDLKRPGTQAAIIATLSVFVASACFYLARPLNQGDETR